MREMKISALVMAAMAVAKLGLAAEAPDPYKNPKEPTVRWYQAAVPLDAEERTAKCFVVRLSTGKFKDGPREGQYYTTMHISCEEPTGVTMVSDLFLGGVYMPGEVLTITWGKAVEGERVYWEVLRHKDHPCADWRSVAQVADLRPEEYVRSEYNYDPCPD